MPSHARGACPERFLDLKPHPITRTVTPSGAQACCSITAEGGLVFAYRVPNADLVLPEAGAGMRRDGLWRTTCFEAFVAPLGDSAYLELNFSPSTDWAAYVFDGYRVGGRDLDMVRPEVETGEAEGMFSLKARVDPLPLMKSPGLYEIGLSAVLEAHEGELTYLALVHPAAKPDFHHRGGFSLELMR